LFYGVTKSLKSCQSWKFRSNPANQIQRENQDEIQEEKNIKKHNIEVLMNKDKVKYFQWGTHLIEVVFNIFRRPYETPYFTKK